MTELGLAINAQRYEQSRLVENMLVEVEAVLAPVGPITLGLYRKCHDR